jgi:heat shock protein HspQ
LAKSLNISDISLSRPGQFPCCKMAGMMTMREAKFGIGEVVCHRDQALRGIIVDVDHAFGSEAEWLRDLSPPEGIRRDQPFYHLLAEHDDEPCMIYVGEDSLMADPTGRPVRHPGAGDHFARFEGGRYVGMAKPMH